MPRKRPQPDGDDLRPKSQRCIIEEIIPDTQRAWSPRYAVGVVLALTLLLMAPAALAQVPRAGSDGPGEAPDEWVQAMIAWRQAFPAWRKETSPPRPAQALWDRIEADFPTQAAWMRRDGDGKHLTWVDDRTSADLEKNLINRVLDDIKSAGTDLRKQKDALEKGKTPAGDRRWLDLYVKACRFRHYWTRLERAEAPALRAAIEDLRDTFANEYKRAPEFLARLEVCQTKLDTLRQAVLRGESPGLAPLAEFDALQREALLANPLLNLDRLLLIKRKDPAGDTKYFRGLGLPNNWQGNCSLPRGGYENEIAVLSPVRPEGRLATLLRPAADECLADMDLHWDANRMLFSMQAGKDRRWQVFEVRTDGTGLRQMTRDEADVSNYDGCYLPDGRIVFDSTAVIQGIPCVSGGDAVANLYRMDADGNNVRQLCFDQDHNWCPTVLPDGRVMYTRWEYSDTPHYFSRILFAMHPDGTGQAELYGSNSYWPNSTFYARPIPAHPTQVVVIVSGHHGNPRMGELVVLDTARGRRDADGVVLRLPTRGRKLEPVIGDEIVNSVWPKFLHPYPLADPATGAGAGKYFLVSCKPSPEHPWGIYLADAWENLVLIHEVPGYALFEPVPLRPTPRPPVVPDRADPRDSQATVYLSDIYAGKGLEAVPKGTVKKLRLFEFHYAYRGMGGHVHVGIDGPWDVHRILGTVPVEEDGSAGFVVPSNTPIAVQPLNERGEAVQIMRSWFTAMPGEKLSCVGCHEGQSDAPPVKATLASRRRASPIEPWRGPARGFSFLREVQPVLDKHCAGCHNGQKRPDGKILPDLRGDRPRQTVAENTFDASYVALHPYVRRPGPESDYRLLRPYEYHVNTSELAQMLRKGHHNVALDEEAWDRLVTWIDLNVPDHGTWGEHKPVPKDWHRRRMELQARYAGRCEDPEAILNPYKPGSVKFQAPPPEPPPAAQVPQVTGWPFDAAEARKRQDAAGLPREIKIDLSGNVRLELVLVPAGQFVMGNPQGAADELPLTTVKIDEPFYVGRLEVTNAQFQLLDPSHDSGVISRYGKDHNNRGVEVGKPDLPVVRVSWRQAAAFCDWLSRKTGREFRLPTEAQWEYACRAGTGTPMYYGRCSDDFGKLANLADASLVLTGGFQSSDWLLKMPGVNDGAPATAPPGRYAPNAWGLCDVHGNVAEWTLTSYKPYPYTPNDGRDSGSWEGLKVVRGGSFYDRPARARSAFRLAYEPYQAVFNVGFRVVCNAPKALAALVPASTGGEGRPLAASPQAAPKPAATNRGAGPPAAPEAPPAAEAKAPRLPAEEALPTRPFVHSLFQDHMMLQRDAQAPVWGWTKPGEAVTVELLAGPGSGTPQQKKTATAGADGRWIARLEPMPASAEPRTLRIRTPNRTVEFQDVLVGDVWVCSGQSNMQGNLQASIDGNALAGADVPAMRFFSAIPGNNDNGTEVPVDDFWMTRGTWQVCSPKTADKLSRTAYYFGRDLHDRLKVPMGLVVVALNGSPIEAWTPREALMSLGAYEAGGQFYAADDPFGEIIPHWHLPCVRYNSLIHPLAPFGIKGFLWYQGETNASWRQPGNRYSKLLALMIRSWRACWGGAEIPFITIQLPSTPRDKEFRDPPRRSGWAEVQHAQAQSLQLPRTGVAITMDLGDGDLHPKAKDKIGARAALAARMVAYGQKLVGMGPTYKAMKIEGAAIRVWFDNVGGGLVSADGEPLRFFAVAGEDRKFVWADAKLDPSTGPAQAGDSVTVSSTKVAKPAAVRYGWVQTGRINLYNKEGLPASAFRTDDWDDPDEKSARLKGPEGAGLPWDGNVAAFPLSPLALAAQKGQTEAVGDLLAASPEAIRRCNAARVNLLNSPIVEGRTAMVRFLLDKGADANIPELSGLYPVHRAAQCGRLEIAQMLLSAGAQARTQARNPGLATPLFFAAQADQADLARLLLDGGADIEAGRQFYRAGSGVEPHSPLHAAFDKPKDGAAACLLIERSARFDRPLAGGDHAIHLAARKNLPKVVQLLLGKGVDVELPNKRNDTPLETAAENGAKETVELLLRKGAKVSPKAIEAARKRSDSQPVLKLLQPTPPAQTR